MISSGNGDIDMKKKLLFAVCICFLMLCGCLRPVTAEAASLQKERVYDYAELLTAEEEAELEQQYYLWSAQAQTDIILVTTDNMEGKSDKVYLEDFQDELYFVQGMLAEDAAVMLINMEDRIVTLQGYGDCEFWLNNDRIEHILDWVYAELTRAAYYDAAISFAEQTVYYMEQDQGVSTEYKPGQDYGEAYGGPSDYYSKPLKEMYTVWEYLGVILSETLFGALLFGLIGATVACLIIASGRKAKVTVYHATYADQNNSGLTANRDDYLRTTVTKIRRPKDSGGGHSGGRSSGGGGRSSGGRSHSGGSRRF